MKRIRRFDLLTTDLGHVLVVCDLTQIPLFLQLNLAYKSITNEDLPVEEVLGTNSERTFLFEDFCILTAEYRYKVSSRRKTAS